MDATIVTAIITGLVTLVSAVTVAAVSIIKALNENRTAIAKELVKSNEVQDKIHTAVNSNYQAMIEKEQQREQQAKVMTAQILELSKMVSMLNERLTITGPDE